MQSKTIQNSTKKLECIFIISISTIGIIGLITISTALLFIKPIELAVIAATLIATFCGTLLTAVLTFTGMKVMRRDVAEVSINVDGRLTELLESVKRERFAEGMIKGRSDRQEEINKQGELR